MVSIARQYLYNMKFITQVRFIFCFLIVIPIFFSSCNTNSSTENIGFSEFYLDMDYSKVKSTMDSLLKTGDLNYYETTDLLGNKQKNLYTNISEVSPSLYAKVNLRGAYIIDERLTTIQLTLCSRSKTGDQQFSYDCALTDLKKLFELYKEKYGTPKLSGQGKEYDWLSKRISNLYFTGPKGRWATDKIYFWEKGNYIIFFDFGYPLNMPDPDNPNTKSVVYEEPDSTSAPIIYYDFSEAYMYQILDKASEVSQTK